MDTFQGDLKISTLNPDLKVEKVIDSNFMFLSLEIPQLPLFKKEKELMPHVSIYELFSKFDGLKLTKKFSRLIENKEHFLAY